MDVPVTDPEGAEHPPPPPPPGGTDPVAGVVGWLASLRRSTIDARLAGVAGGLAARLGVPVVLVRVGFVLATLVGFGIPAYLLAWVLVPDDRGGRVLGRNGARDVVALVAVAASGLLLMGQVAGVSPFRLAWRLSPWVLLFVGSALLLRRAESPARPDRDRVAAPATPDASFGPPAPRAERASVRARVRSARRPFHRPVLGPLTWCMVLVVVGGAGFAASRGNEALTPGVIAAACLVVFGAGLVVSAFLGRARGLLLPSLALALALGGLGALDLRANTTAASFQRTASSEDELPASLSTALGSSTIDLRDLVLDRDRELRIDHTAGDLELGLPTNVTTEVEVHNAHGDTSIMRPALSEPAWVEPEVAAHVAEAGLPEPGDPLDHAIGSERWWWSVPTDFGESIGQGVRIATTRTFDNDSAHTLRIIVHMGVGSVRLYDPHWSASSEFLVEPTQLCAVAEGPRGVVSPCDDVPEGDRVALCINGNDFLVDCREDRPATPDWPRVAACSGYTGQHRACDAVGIDPVGAELVTPGLTSTDPFDEGVGGESSPQEDPSPPGTIAPLRRATTTTIDGEPEPEPPAPVAETNPGDA